MTGWPRLPPARTCRTAPAHRRRARRHRKGAFGLPSLHNVGETMFPPRAPFFCVGARKSRRGPPGRQSRPPAATRSSPVTGGELSGLQNSERLADGAGASCDDGLREGADRGARLGVRGRLEHRSPRVRRLAQRGIEWNLREERRADLRSERLAAAAAEEL